MPSLPKRRLQRHTGLLSSPKTHILAPNIFGNFSNSSVLRNRGSFSLRNVDRAQNFKDFIWIFVSSTRK